VIKNRREILDAVRKSHLSMHLSIFKVYLNLKKDFFFFFIKEKCLWHIIYKSFNTMGYFKIEIKTS